MRILVVCPHFAPDVAPTGEVMTAIVDRWAHAGHQVDVVTSLPWYEHHRVAQGWGGAFRRREVTPWGSITRLHPFPTDKTNIPARALAFGGFTAAAGLDAAFRQQRPDVVLAMSPPLILGLAGWAAAERFRVPLVLNIQDVFPDVAIEVGALNGRRVIAAARALERFCYRRADAVTVLSDDLRDNVAKKVPFPLRGRVRVIPNFVDTDRVAPMPPGESTGYRREFGIENKVVVMYAGNLGYSQSVDMLVDAAAEMRDERDVVFVVNGAGSGKDALVERARGLDNVLFVGLQPRERLAEVLASADVHTVLLRRGLGRSSVPSKTYSVLAASRPVVASVDRGTEVERIVELSGSGRVVGPGDHAGFVAALREMVGDPALRVRCGAAGRDWVERWLTPRAVADSYVELFEELASSRRRASG